jgi:uncharacterized membrane protein YoaK (UPF0700 family)
MQRHVTGNFVLLGASIAEHRAGLLAKLRFDSAR